MHIGMADNGMLWIYLIFLIVPLARILPRLIRRWRGVPVTEDHNQYDTEYFGGSQNVEAFDKPQKEESFDKPQSVEMVVLGEINSGVKNFNSIQKNLGMSSQELEGILKRLEDQEMMKVVTKGGLFGTKVELHTTEKGRKKQYS